MKIDKTLSCLFGQVSQNVQQGTANPTSYNVIVDESGLSANQIQIFTFKARLAGHTGVDLTLSDLKPFYMPYFIEYRAYFFQFFTATYPCFNKPK